MFCVRSAPQPKFAGIPAVEVLRPVGQQLRVVERAPAPDDRVADEVDVDAALLRLLEQLRVRGHRVLIGARRRPVGRHRRALRHARRAPARLCRRRGRDASQRQREARRIRRHPSWPARSRLLRARRDRGGVLQEPVGPRNEVLPVRAVGVAAVVLAPGELAVEQPDVDRRHLLRLVVVRHAERPSRRAGGRPAAPRRRPCSCPADRATWHRRVRERRS